MARPVHPDKDIEAALSEAELLGWRVEKSGPRAHCWGILLCPFKDRNGCRFSIWGTPKNPTNFAKQVRKLVRNCAHQNELEKEMP